MKNLNELLQEKQKFAIEKDKANEKYYNFNKPTHPDMEQMKQYKNLLHEDEQRAKEYYCKIKEVAEKNRLEKKELEKQKNIYQLAYEMVDINIITAFENLHKKKILDILNKYVKKRIGQKTKEKIENEIKKIDENIKSCYLYINEGLGENKITIFYGNENNKIKIELNKDIPGNWLNEDGETIKNFYNFYSYNYKYIADILQFATQKVEEKEKLEKETEEEIKAIREKIRSFNNFYCNDENKFKIDEYSIFR